MSNKFDQYIHKDKKVFASNGQTSFFAWKEDANVNAHHFSFICWIIFIFRFHYLGILNFLIF